MAISLTKTQNEVLLAAMGRSFRRTARPIRMQGRAIGVEFDDQAMLDTILDLIDEFEFEKSLQQKTT